MDTQHNIFIRKFGQYAVIITVTDWNDFKELEKQSSHENPDFLLSGVTSKSIYTNMNPSIIVATKGEVKDITNETVGMGLGAIITGDSKVGPIWAYKKINGLFVAEDAVTCEIKSK